MRFDTNQVFQNGVVVDQTVVPWTLEQYNSAINSIELTTNALRNELLNERAVLLGVAAMTARIDEVADAKRLEFLGDTTRAFEYQAAERDARSFAAAGFEGDVPNNVQSWALAAGLTAKQAAENIIQEARLYNYALDVVRLFRLQGKQAIKAASTPEQAGEAYMMAIVKISSISPG